MYLVQEKRDEIDHHPSWAVHHYCFHLPEDSKLRHEHLKEVGIGFPEDVGEWIVKTFRQKLDQKDLADRLKDFLKKQEQSSLRDQAGSKASITGMYVSIKALSLPIIYCRDLVIGAYSY